MILKKLVNFYIEEYPVDKEDEGSGIDVVDALWNYDPFTGIWEDTLEIPDDLDSFHLCVQDGYTGQTVDCLEMDGSIFSDSDFSPLKMYVAFFLVFLCFSCT
jgi:hypothetical protein